MRNLNELNKYRDLAAEMNLFGRQGTKETACFV